MTLSIHPDPLDPPSFPYTPDYLIVGRIDPLVGVAEEAGSPPRYQQRVFLHEVGVQPGAANLESGDRGPYLYQAVVSLPPGKYRASFAAFDRARRKTGSYGSGGSPSFSVRSLA